MEKEEERERGRKEDDDSDVGLFIVMPKRQDFNCIQCVTCDICVLLHFIR